jgi:AAA15 family ATPase/GTPase
LPEEEKLGKNSFEDLIKYKEENINKDIELIVSEIKSINISLIELEKEAHPTFKNKLIKELEIKNKELEEHLKNKPKEIKNPDSDETTKEQYKKVSEQLLELNKKREKIEKEILKCEKDKIFLKQKIEKLSNIKQNIVRFENEIKSFKLSQKEELQEYNLNIDEIIKYEINLQELDKLISKQKSQYSKILYQLFTEKDIIENFKDEEHKALKEKSLIIQQSSLLESIEKLKNQLSEPYKKYQEYLENLNKWKKTKKEIEGDKDSLKTIEWYKSKINYIETELNSIIDSNRTDRINKSVRILKEKLELVSVYNKLKKSVDNEILAYKGILKDYDINIDVALKLSTRFAEIFLSYINQNKTGSFYQKDQGKMRIEKLIENKNFQDTTELEKFLKEIIENLEIDKREEHNNAVRYIIEQINSDNIFDFYNYIFSINYLEPSYELKLGDKHITELSPGEKGAMLIVFYLMLEKDNIPLIIDQPEENLDNESIYKILVHFIKETKKRRQVILVTHNPNLAIVGDSEQIIYVNIDKKNGNRFNFESGAIENPVINKHASKILEGTIKAFNIRRLKYLKV